MQVNPYSDPTAVMGRRIVAYIVDSIIVFAIAFITFFALAETNPFSFSQGESESIGRAFDQNSDSDFQSAWDFGEGVGGYISFDNDTGDVDLRIVTGGSFWAVNLIGLAGGLGFLVLMQGTTGKTPGKAMLGITTVNAEGQVPGIGRAFVRWLLLFVDAFFILPGLITSLVSKGHRRIGDMAAGTYVVSAAAAGQPVAVGGAAPVPQYQPYQQPPPQQPAPGYGQPAPDAQWDPARQAWIRWDGTTWTQYDPSVPGGWRPI